MRCIDLKTVALGALGFVALQAPLAAIQLEQPPTSALYCPYATFDPPPAIAERFPPE